jgi:hypothetical protein
MGLAHNQRHPEFVFVPSVSDIEDYRGSDTYYCGLAEVEREVHAIQQQLMEEFYRCDPSDRRLIPRLVVPEKFERGYWPDFFFNLGILMTSSATSALLYKLIDSWIAHRNGRKFRVRLPNGFEVEASQLTEQEFEKLFQYLYGKYGPERTFEISKKELTRLGFRNRGS